MICYNELIYFGKMKEFIREENMKFEVKSMKNAMLLIAFTILFTWSVFHFETILNGVSSIVGIVKPFIIGGIIAFILNVLMSSLESIWDKLFEKQKQKFSGIKRPICMLLSFVIIIAMIIVLFSMIIPELGRTATMLVDMVPAFLKKINELPIPSNLLPNLEINWEKILETIANIVGAGGKALLDTTVSLASNVSGIVLDVVLGIVFSIYVLLQKEDLGRQVKKLFRAYFSEKKVERIFYILSLSSNIFSKYVTGQVTEAFIIGALCFLGMSLFSIPYAFMVSVLVGVTALIPMFGAFIGTAIGAFLILMVEPIKAIWFVVFILVLQQLEGNLIYPKVVGKSVGLPGIWVLCAVTIGAGGLGLGGMLVSVPVCSILYALLKEDVNKKITEKQSDKREKEKQNEEVK